MAFQQHARRARQTVVWRRWIRLVAVSLAAVALLSTAAVAESGNPLKPADTSSPRDTLRSFYDACNEAYSRAKERRQSGGYYRERKAILQRLLECLDLSEVPPNVREDVGVEAAVCLKEVIEETFVARIHGAGLWTHWQRRQMIQDTHEAVVAGARDIRRPPGNG